MGYRAYPQYRDSGVEWFGQVPSHWQESRLKWTTESLKNGVWGNEPTGDDDDLYCIRVADFDRTRLGITSDNLTLRSIPRKDRVGRMLSRGDLLIEKSGGGDKQLVGVVVEYTMDEPVVCSNFIAALATAPRMHNRYLAYLHAHLYQARVNYRSIKQSTGIQNLDAQAYFDELVFYPDPEEQARIAGFIDYKAAQIDHLIEKKQELLEKLEEQRIAISTLAVTKGLDASVPMQDSGVEWLGQTPRHWSCHRLRFAVEMSGGMTPSTTTQQYWDGDIPWVTPKDMKTERVSDSIDKLTEIALEETALKLYEPEQVLIVVRGMILAHTFPVAINDVPVTINQDMKALSTTFHPEYLAILLRGLQGVMLSVVEESAHGTKVLRTDLFKDILLPVPPRPEQVSIVAHVHEVTAKVDSRIAAANAAIERLQEYRSALITAAVTGQIDVRDWQAPAAISEPATDTEVA